MKKLYAISFITILLIYINFFSDNVNSDSEVGKNSLVNDSFIVANIYVLGQVPMNFGVPDTLACQFKKVIAGSRIIKIRVTIHNDSANGPVKDTYESTISNTAAYDTTIKFTLNQYGELKKDFVIVQALPGDVGIVLLDDTLNNKLSEYYYTTAGIYNHADPGITSSSPLGFNGKTGKFVAAFRNKNVSSYYIHQIDYSILSSTFVGIQTFQLVIYNDNGSGKPGSLIYSSSTLTPPFGPNVPVTVTYNLDSALAISPNNRFYVGYKQTSTFSIDACSQPETPVRPKSFFFTSSDTSNTWYDFRDSSKNLIPDISVIGYTGVLNLSEIVEARYPQTNDTVRAYLYNLLPPFYIIDSSKALDTGGNTKFYFSKTINGESYYLVLKHRNSLETWSGSTVNFVNNTLTYNFTSSSSQAFGNNMKYVNNSSWCLYSGDTNFDGTIDASDIIQIYNDMIAMTSGYVITDLTGDNFVDTSDLLYCYNNSINSVTVITPP